MAEYKLSFTGEEIEEKLDVINNNGIYNVPKDLRSLIIDNNKVIVKRGNDEEGTVLLDADQQPLKFTTFNFSFSNYYIDEITIKNSQNVNFELNGATILPNKPIEEMHDKELILVMDSPDFTIKNGILNGNSIVQKGLQILNSIRPTVKNLTITNIGNWKNGFFSEESNKAEGKKFKNLGITSPIGLSLLGDCSYFLIQQCQINHIYSLLPDTDGDQRIHAYGIQINEKKEVDDYNRILNKTYSCGGIISECIIEFINRDDDDEDKIKPDDNTEPYIEYEGEGIFIQQLPYEKYEPINDSELIEIPHSNITVDKCKFRKCKKRGMKITAREVYVKNSFFYDEYYFAPIEFQYGDGLVKNCYVENLHSSNNDGIVGGIVLCEGGVTIKDTYIKSKSETADYHPGIVFNNRNNRSPYHMTNEPWKKCIFKRITIDESSTPIEVKGEADWVYEYDEDGNKVVDENGNPKKIKYRTSLMGLDIIDCQFENVKNSYFVECAAGTFVKINSLHFIDFKSNAVKPLKGQDSNLLSQLDYIRYPINLPREYTKKEENKAYLKISDSLEIHSKYWLGEVCVTHGKRGQITDDEGNTITGIVEKIPTPPNTLIIHGPRDKMKYKKYTYFNTQFVGTVEPVAPSSTSSGLTGADADYLYDSRIGDEYIFIEGISISGEERRIKYICSEPGRESGIGTWILASNN